MKFPGYFIMLLATGFMLLVACFMLLSGCDFSDKPVRFHHQEEPFAWLSEYRFFTGRMAVLTPNERVVPYDLNTQLFSDYTKKQRFIWMPEGVSGTYDETEVFELPVGTVLIKNFYYPDDFRDPSSPRTILETRLLVHGEDGWRGLPYIWNDDQTDAMLSLAGGDRHISFIHDSGETLQTRYLIPNVNQCQSCHLKDGKMVPIGTAVRHLNKDYPYEDGTQNQLIRWQQSGYLQGVPDPKEAPRLSDAGDPGSGTVDMRARAYLDINCAHCHSPGGPARTSGLFLRSDVENPTAIGIWKPPVAAGRGSGGKSFSVVPGNPEDSILLYRMVSTEPGIMMPEIGRTLVHSEAVELIREWINGMDAGDE